MKTRTRTLFTVLFLIILAVAFIILAVFLSKANDSYRNLDFFTFWLGSRMAASGQNPYDQTLWVAGHTQNNSTWIENLFYVYPLTTALFFLPFGFLNISTASILWIFLTLVSIAAGVIFLLSLWPKVEWQAYLLPILIGAFAFRPAYLNLFVGQVDGFLFFFIAFAVFLFSKNKPRWACVFLALTVIKPNIGGLLIVFFAIYLLAQKKRAEFLTLIGTTAALLLPPLLLDPHWMSNYFQVLLHKSADANLFPNLHGLAGLLAGNSLPAATVLWLILSALLISLLLFLFVKRAQNIDAQVSISLSLLSALLITPYLRAYDLTFVLVPIFLITGLYAARSSSFLKINLAFLAWPLAAFLLLFVASLLQHDILSVLLSLAALFFLIVHIRREALSLTKPLS